MRGTPHILLVEDDPRLAALIVELLEAANYAVDGPYATLAEGAAAVAHRLPGGAVLDVRLADGDAGLLADDLDSYDIPYLFCSGAGEHPVLADHPDAPLLLKPAIGARLVTMLDAALEKRALH